MAISRRDYDKDSVEAARRVLLELVHLLGEYKDDILIIGGWVPDLLIPAGELKHAGSVDVDLAFNHKTFKQAGYQTIKRLLERRRYKPAEQPFIFYRKVEVGGSQYEVQVDFLAGEYQGTGMSRRTQKVQDLKPRKARGCDLAFEIPAAKVKLEGRLPGGAKDSVVARVASIVPFIIMKGMALDDRLNPKDAWDIYFCLKNYPGGVEALAELFKPYVSLGLVREGLEKIASKFLSPEHVGPVLAADFEEIKDLEERHIMQRDAYGQVRHLLDSLGIKEAI